MSASHPSWKLDGESREVAIEWGNAQVAEDFVVRGYDLSGSVVAEGNPILGVQVRQPRLVILTCILDFEQTEAPVSSNLQKGKDPELCKSLGKLLVQKRFLLVMQGPSSFCCGAGFDGSRALMMVSGVGLLENRF